MTRRRDTPLLDVPDRDPPLTVLAVVVVKKVQRKQKNPPGIKVIQGRQDHGRGRLATGIPHGTGGRGDVATRHRGMIRQLP